MLLPPAALLFLLIIYGPSEQYFANVYDFSFDIYDLLAMLVPVFGAVLLIVAVVMFFIKRLCPAAVGVILALFLGSFLAFYIQGTFFSNNLPVIDGHIIDWSEYSYMRIQSAFIWAVCLGVSFIVLIALKSWKFTNISAISAGAAVAFLLLSSVLSGVMGNGFVDKDDVLINYDHINELSDEQNFIVILLDAVDANAFNEMIEEKPEITDSLDGFTFFKNAMSCYDFTAYSIPEILSGKKYLCGENFNSYLQDVYLSSPLFEYLSSRDYSMNLYFHEMPRVYDWVKQFDNIGASNKLAGFLYPSNFVKTMIKLSGIKYFPYDLKRYCNVTPTSLAGDSEKIGSGDRLFNSDLFTFYNMIDRLEFNAGYRKNFSFVYLDGAHSPFETMGDLSYSPFTTYNDEVEASFTAISGYLEKLKSIDVYDNSVIVILADHGYSWKDGIGRQNPLLLVKGTGEKARFSVNNTPVSYENICTVFQSLLEGSPSSQAIGEHSIDERVYYHSNRAIGETEFEECIQYGYADDLDTLKPTGKVYSFN